MLENARSCLRGGVRSARCKQLDQRFPRLREKTAAVSADGDDRHHARRPAGCRTVVKASQAVSGEIELAS